MMTNTNTGQRFNRTAVCPLSTKARRVQSLEKNKMEDYTTDLKRGEQVYAVKSYSDHRNNKSLTFSEGDVITLLDQFTDGMCTGYITRHGVDSKIGMFPTTCVVPFTKNNINSINPNYIRKGSRRTTESKEKEKPTNIRDQERPFPTDNMHQPKIDNSHMYSCNYIDFRSCTNVDPRATHPVDAINRGSTCSVDSGRGSTTVAMMNCIKMNMPINHLSTQFDQPQFIPENYVSQSIESGLASYQRHSSSSSSSIGGGSSTDGSKHNSGFIDNEHRPILRTTFEEEDKDETVIKNWLQEMNLDIYAPNFINAGYDFNTLLRMTPEDLNAIGITNPKHRKLIKHDVSNRVGTIGENLPESLPASVEEWLGFLKLSQYLEIILQQGYDKVEKVTDLTWEDLEEIGIKKLGHQKKIMLAVEKLKKFIKTGPSDKLSMSYSAENFRDPKSPFVLADTSPVCVIKHQGHSPSPAYLDLSRYSSSRFVTPVHRRCDMTHSANTNPLYSPSRAERFTIIDSGIPPPTPKRISSILSSPQPRKPVSQSPSQKKPHENLIESCEKDSTPSKIRNKTVEINDSMSPLPETVIAEVTKPPSPSNVRLRSTSIMIMETNCLPFANENCGTIKQRSSSLDRTDILRDEIDCGVLSLKSNVLSTAKLVLPLTLPYSIDSLSFKSTNLSQKLKENLSTERNIQIIPSDVNIAVREKVLLPKLHMEDNSSNEDFNEICDMLEDLTELLDKEVSRDH